MQAKKVRKAGERVERRKGTATKRIPRPRVNAPSSKPRKPKPKYAEVLHLPVPKGGRMVQETRLTVQVDVEEDGRFIGEVPEIPGALVYGTSREEARAKVKALALRVLADRVAHGELAADALTVIRFVVAA